jgi:N-acetylneuraminic acid mutarotase
MNTYAQISSTIPIHFGKPIDLPKSNTNTSSIGFAGMISGKINHFMIVAGGANFPDEMPWLGGNKQYHHQVYIYKNNNEQLELVDTSQQLPYSLAYAACYSMEDQIFVVGGENKSGIQQEAFVITMQNGKVQYKYLPKLPYPVTNAMLIVNDNQLYVVGGENEKQTFAYIITLDLKNIKAGWKYLQPMLFPLSHGVIALQKINETDQLFVLGGRAKKENDISAFNDAILRYDFKEDKWKQVGKLPYPIAAGTGIPLNTHEIVLLGGDKGIVFNQVERLIQEINHAPNLEQKALLNQQKIQLQSTHPGFSNEVLLFNSVKMLTSKVTTAPFGIPVTSGLLQFGKTFYITSGEIRAGVRSPYIYTFTIAQHD